MSPGLYVVATPIGHLSDLSPRAAQTLCGADVVAAEDTRVTRVLLRHAGSSARLISARAHNEQAAAQQIVGLLAEGRSVVYLNDARYSGPSGRDGWAGLRIPVRGQAR